MTWPMVSFGCEIKRPSQLEPLPMGEIFESIGGGRWGHEVHQVRKLAYHSDEQQKMKERLPFWTPSGFFRYRNAEGLVRHSGHVAIDLDNLGAEGATAAIQTATADQYCRCAFRSATAQGVRLIFVCPPCNAAAHRPIFARIADHVRSRYKIEPDTSASDVARASFVSFDRGIWLNLSAVMLPGLLDALHTRTSSLCVVRGLSGGDLNTLAFGLGESRAPSESKDDGTCWTHLPLRNLARDLVVRYRRHRLALGHCEIEIALRAWWDTGKRRGLHFRHACEAYRDELFKAIRCVRVAPWLDRVVRYWPRWVDAPGFPASATSDERLLWAIKQRCEEKEDARFFLSARDAATITGTTFKAANDALHRLMRERQIVKAGKRLNARDAQQ